MAKKRLHQKRLRILAGSHNEPRKNWHIKIMHSSAGIKLCDSHGDMMPIIVYFRGQTVRIPITPKLLRNLKTNCTSIRVIVKKKLIELYESELSVSYSFLMSTIKGNYPVDPEKGITIIPGTEEQKPNEENPVIGLPALGTLSREEYKLLVACAGKDIHDLDPATRKRYRHLLSKISRLIPREKMMKAKYKVGSRKNSETELESEELVEQEDSREK